MKPQSIPVGSKTKIDVILVDDTHQLETAIVIGYGTAKKRDLKLLFQRDVLIMFLHLMVS